MADNRPIATVPPVNSNVTLAADDVSSVWYDIHKLAFGALETATLVSTSNGLPVNVVAGSAGGTQYTEDDAAAADPVGNALIMVRDDALSGQTTTDGDNVAARGTDKGELYVKHTDSIAVTGTVDLGATDNAVLDAIAASVAAIDTDATTIIGHVDGIEGLLGTIDADTGSILTSVQLIDNVVKLEDDAHTSTDAGVFILAVRNDDGATQVGGANLDYTPIAVNNRGAVKMDGPAVHDTALQAASSPMLLGGAASATLPTAVSADADAVRAWFLRNGIQMTSLWPADIDTTAQVNHAQKYYTSAGAATDGIIWSPAAGKRWHITSLYINVSAAATVTLEDDLAGGDVTILKSEFAANSGVHLRFDPQHPWASTEDAADLIITTSAGNVYVTVVGYEV